MEAIYIAIYNLVLETLHYNCKDAENPWLILFEPGIPSVNIGGTTILSGLGIKTGLNSRSKIAFNYRWAF